MVPLPKNLAKIMFADAVTLTSKFTRPLLISTRHQSGRIDTGCGSYVLLNPDGWILTAGHVLGAWLRVGSDKPKYDAYRAAETTIENDANLSKGQKKNKLRALKPDPEWLTNVSYWWSADNIMAGTFHTDELADLAVVQLLNQKLPADQKFPKFGDPAVELPQGRSLCKLGFPFHTFKTDFDEGTKNFVIKDLPALVRYPLDGILTRYNLHQSPDGKRAAKFVEVSTPGLRGQSGGPIFDIKGTVWGVQSRTHHLPLGFSPEVEVNSKKVTEHQFLNSGAAAYVSEIVRFLERHSSACDKV
jgi:S1-C subfamily serine protease